MRLIRLSAACFVVAACAADPQHSSTPTTATARGERAVAKLDTAMMAYLGAHSGYPATLEQVLNYATEAGQRVDMSPFEKADLSSGRTFARITYTLRNAWGGQGGWLTYADPGHL
jgi:hypothetical protein